MKMKRILFLCVVLVGLSCNKEKEIKENQFMPVVQYYIANEIGLDLSKQGTSVAIVQIDTLTEKDRLATKTSDLVRRLKEKQQELNQTNPLENQITITSTADLEETNQETAGIVLGEYQRLRNEMDWLTEELRTLEAKYETADSVQFIAYNVQAVLKYLTKAHIEKAKEITVIVDGNLNAISAEEFIK